MNEVVPFVDKDGNQRFATADRNGYFYVLNRQDGAYVNAWPFVQNISWASGIDDTGRPIYNEDNRPGAAAKAQKPCEMSRSRRKLAQPGAVVKDR